MKRGQVGQVMPPNRANQLQQGADEQFVLFLHRAQDSLKRPVIARPLSSYRYIPRALAKKGVHKASKSQCHRKLLLVCPNLIQMMPAPLWTLSGLISNPAPNPNLNPNQNLNPNLNHNRKHKHKHKQCRRQRWARARGGRVRFRC
jgi:hypothetical protein